MENVILSSFKLTDLEQLIRAAIRDELKSQKTDSEDADRWLSIDELREYLPDHPAKQTIYGWTSNYEIPFHKRQGQKAVYFLKSEIDAWLVKGRKKTIAEIQGK